MASLGELPFIEVLQGIIMISLTSYFYFFHIQNALRVRVLFFLINFILGNFLGIISMADGKQELEE